MLSNGSGVYDLAALNNGSEQTWTGQQFFKYQQLIIGGNGVSGGHQLLSAANGGVTWQMTFPNLNDTVATLIATQTLTNTTLAGGSGSTIGGVTMTLGADATGDTYYRNGSGILSRLAVGSGSGVLTVSGGLPAWTTVSALIDAVFGSARGDIIYRSPTGWTALAPGTSGQLLQTGGTGANPTWITSAAGGGVTQLVAGSGIFLAPVGGTGIVTVSIDETISTTWTPSDGSGAGLSFTSVQAFYTRVGKMVTVVFDLTYPSTASGATGQVNGLPFAPKATTNTPQTFLIANGVLSNNIVAVLTHDGSTAGFNIAAVGSNTTFLTNVSLSTTRISGTFTYLAA